MLRTALLAKLPEYMEPTAFVSLEQLPLTANGKLDRKALPNPEGASSQTAYRAPSTEYEILLCSLFSELTGTTPVGVDDSFFAIGGHSLLAMRLIASIRENQGRSLSLRHLFNHPTPAGLANIIEQQETEQEESLEAGIAHIPLVAGMGRKIN